MNDYYVYEILIDGIVRYVGISQKRFLQYDKSDPHYWGRLKDHGFFMTQFAAKKRIESGRLGRRPEIVKAKAEGREVSYNIVLDGVSAEEAGRKEHELINKHRIMIELTVPVVENGECLLKKDRVGQLTNKINSPRTVVNNSKGRFTKEAREKAKGWYENLSDDEKLEYNKTRSEYYRDFMERYPEKYAEINKKMHDGSRKACCKETRSDETFKKQSENMKKRWARNEYWIEAKNKQSSEFMKKLHEDPAFKEYNRQRRIEKNKDPEFQLRRVCKIRKLMIENDKDTKEWRKSFLELVAEGKISSSPAMYRDWKKYFTSEDEMIKFYNKVYEN